MKHIAAISTLAGFFLVIATGPASAQAETLKPADIKAGKVTAKICAACHGADGMSDQPDVPHLSGQHESYIRQGLLSYKDGQRHGTRMATIVTQLSEQDIANVAAYYSSLTRFDKIVKRKIPVEPKAEDPFAEIREATADCGGCHGVDGNTDVPGMPSLAGQHVGYLIEALKHYQDGIRKDEGMQAFVEGLTSAQIEDMAYYYAAMQPKQAEPASEGDAIAGLAVTAPCVGCHGDDGNSKDPKTPRLAGLDAEYLVAAAEGYLGGSRDHEVMREALSSMRESEIRDMAAYYASKPPKPLPVRKPFALAEWVERCSRCHSVGGHADDSRFPIIAGQNEVYLASALRRYHGGERESSMMFAMSFLMTETDIAKLAAYYSGQGAD